MLQVENNVASGCVGGCMCVCVGGGGGGGALTPLTICKKACASTVLVSRRHFIQTVMTF